MARTTVLFVAGMLAALGGGYAAYRSYRGHRPDGVARTVVVGIRKDAPPARPAGTFDGDPASIRRMTEGATRTALVYSEAEVMAARGLVSEAIAKLEAHLEQFPERIEIKRLLAQFRLHLGQYDSAGPLVTDVLRADPRDAPARLMLTEVLMSKGQSVSAYESAKWALELLPRDPVALRNAGRAALHAGWPQAALPHLLELREIRRTDPECQQLIGLCHLRMGEYAKAIYQFDEILREGKADESVYFNLAVCHAQQKQVQGAVDVLSRAAHQFGAARISSWIASQDFRPVRTDAYFSAFVSQLGLAPMPSDDSVRAGQGMGMMPESATSMRPRGDYLPARRSP